MLLMSSRMDKYNQVSRDASSRTTKNQQLYKDVYSNKTYTEFTSMDKDNVIELNTGTTEPISRRSNTSRTRMFYEDMKNRNSNKDIVNMNSSYQRILEEQSDRSYNINDILEHARKNRTDLNEEERKRKIKSAEYSILSDLSKEKLKEYQERKEKGITKYEEENIEELIHTITSNSLRQRIDDQLLEDLLPQNDSDTLISKTLLEEIENGKVDDIDDDTKDQSSNTSEIEKGLDKSFYTRSMDLKKEDLIVPENEEENDTSFEEEKEGPLKIVVGILLILIVLGIVGFIFYKYFLVQ